jgi:hypothetical protein
MHGQRLQFFILLVNFNPFLWTLNKVWPLNPTASRLGRPYCEAALNDMVDFGIGCVGLLSQKKEEEEEEEDYMVDFYL